MLVASRVVTGPYPSRRGDQLRVSFRGLDGRSLTFRPASSLSPGTTRIADAHSAPRPVVLDALGYPATPDRSFMSYEHFTWRTPFIPREDARLRLAHRAPRNDDEARCIVVDARLSTLNARTPSFMTHHSPSLDGPRIPPRPARRLPAEIAELRAVELPGAQLVDAGSRRRQGGLAEAQEVDGHGQTLAGGRAADAE